MAVGERLALLSMSMYNVFAFTTRCSHFWFKFVQLNVWCNFMYNFIRQRFFCATLPLIVAGRSSAGYTASLPYGDMEMF